MDDLQFSTWFLAYFSIFDKYAVFQVFFPYLSKLLTPALLNRAKIAPWPGPERALPIALFGVVNYQ
jgi:hypothetical protein